MPPTLNQIYATRLFADDNLLYRCISTSDESALLQQDLNALLEWETRSMVYEVQCFQVSVAADNQQPQANLGFILYTIHGHNLELVDSAKYLGLHLDSKLNFNKHVDAKANATRAFLCRTNLSHCG